LIKYIIIFEFLLIFSKLLCFFRFSYYNHCFHRYNLVLAVKFNISYYSKDSWCSRYDSRRTQRRM